MAYIKEFDPEWQEAQAEAAEAALDARLEECLHCDFQGYRRDFEMLWVDRTPVGGEVRLVSLICPVCDGVTWLDDNDE